MNCNFNKKTLVASVLSLTLCFAMLLGTTFAWFTDKVTTGANMIISGDLEVALLDKDGNSLENSTTLFQDKNGNTSNLLWEPNATFKTLDMFVKNNGNLALKYKLILNVTGQDAAKLLEVLAVTVTMGGETVDIADFEGKLMPGYQSEAIVVRTHMDQNADEKYENLEAALSLTVLATQLDSEEDSFGKDYDANAEYQSFVDKWDGTADTSWYDPANPLTEYKLGTAEQLAGLSELVAGDTTFAGVTFTLTNDIDLYCEDTSASADGDPVTFRPIGDHSKDGTFEGVFEGNGKTISNIYQNGWDLGYEWGAYGSYGLFGNLNNAVVKNLTLSGGESYIEGGDVSFVAGSATGTCVFENITIEDSIAATYNNGCGGIIGWSGAGNYTFKNITLAEDVVLGGLWGSFDSSIGGVVGQAEPGASYTFENVNIACRIDAYNDCTASYDYYNYRMCGMIIGRMEQTTTIDGVNYPDTSGYNITCTNVTVTYGDWMNYHYCEPTPANMNGGRGMRVEPGYAYDGLPTDYDHSQCTTNHMNLLPFDQIFGGAQLGVKGLKTYEGVLVVYPNN